MSERPLLPPSGDRARDEDREWYGRWELGLPAPEELTPLSQSLITPVLACAFSITKDAGRSDRSEADVDKAAKVTLTNLYENPRVGNKGDFPASHYQQYSSMASGSELRGSGAEARAYYGAGAGAGGHYGSLPAYSNQGMAYSQQYDSRGSAFPPYSYRNLYPPELMDPRIADPRYPMDLRGGYPGDLRHPPDLRSADPRMAPADPRLAMAADLRLADPRLLEHHRPFSNSRAPDPREPRMGGDPRLVDPRFSGEYGYAIRDHPGYGDLRIAQQQQDRWELSPLDPRLHLDVRGPIGDGRPALLDSRLTGGGSSGGGDHSVRSGPSVGGDGMPDLRQVADARPSLTLETPTRSMPAHIGESPRTADSRPPPVENQRPNDERILREGKAASEGFFSRAGPSGDGPSPGRSGFGAMERRLPLDSSEVEGSKGNLAITIGTSPGAATGGGEGTAPAGGAVTTSTPKKARKVNDADEDVDSGPNLSGATPADSSSEDQLPRTLKRPRLVWTPQLHKRFVDAVGHLGIKNAVPKTIMQLMNVEGLTRENVASHLQKYRLYLKRMQGLSNEGPSPSDHLFSSTPLPPNLGSPPQHQMYLPTHRDDLGQRNHPVVPYSASGMPQSLPHHPSMSMDPMRQAHPVYPPIYDHPGYGSVMGRQIIPSRSPPRDTRNFIMEQQQPGPPSASPPHRILSLFPSSGN